MNNDGATRQYNTQYLRGYIVFLSVFASFSSTSVTDIDFDFDGKINYNIANKIVINCLRVVTVVVCAEEVCFQEIEFTVVNYA